MTIASLDVWSAVFLFTVFGSYAVARASFCSPYSKFVVLESLYI